jgi:hypothetical protein
MELQTDPQMELLEAAQAPVPLDVMKAMQRLFNRRWRPWHRCQRFEDAVRDPLTFRLLRLAVERGQRRDATE